MTAASSDHTANGISSPRESSRVTSVWLLGRLGLALPWFVPIVFLIQSSLYILIDGFGGSLSISLWEGIAANAQFWFVFAMGTSLTYSYLPVHVAHGGTRRSFVTATTLAIIVGALLLALTMPIGYLLESLIYDRYDWVQAFRGEHLFENWRQIGPLLLEYGLRYAFAGVLGTMVAGTYYRLGNIWATVLLPVTVLLPLALESRLVYSSGSPATSDANLGWLNTESLPLALRFVLVAVVIVLIVLTNYLVVRRTAIRTKPG